MNVEAVFESSAAKISRVISEIEDSLIIQQLKYQLPLLDLPDVVLRFETGFLLHLLQMKTLSDTT